MESRRSGRDTFRADDGSALGRPPDGPRRLDGEQPGAGLERRAAVPRQSREAREESRIWAEVDALPYREPDLPPKPEVPRPLNDEEQQEVGRKVLEILDPEAWRTADIPQRMRMAQHTHAFIREAYGLDSSPLLYDLNLPPQVAGRFDPRAGIVSINANLLDDDHPGELLDTLAHENTHAVQVHVVRELGAVGPAGNENEPRWSAARRWSDAWKGYDAGNAEAYFHNAMERDARRAGLQLAGNGYWRAYMERLANTQGGSR